MSKHPGKPGSGISGAWRPDVRVSFGGAAAAALLVLAGFAVLFSATPGFQLSHDTDRLREQLDLAELAAPPPPMLRPRLRAPAPSPNLPLVQSAWPPLPAPVATPGGFGIQDYLDQRARGDAAELRDRVTGGDLKRELGKPMEKPALPDNQGYRSVDGHEVVHAGGGCAEVHTLQVSPSPSNHVAVAEPISCPGASEQDDMGKALQDWAEKHRPPPPR